MVGSGLQVYSHFLPRESNIRPDLPELRGSERRSRLN